MKPNILVFAVESTSLFGTAFAVGAVVIDKTGKELDTFQLLSKQGKELASDWVKKNVLPHLEHMPTCDRDLELRDSFFEFYIKHKDTCEIWADCAFPVETNFLNEIASMVDAISS